MIIALLFIMLLTFILAKQLFDSLESLIGRLPGWFRVGVFILVLLAFLLIFADQGHAQNPFRSQLQ